MQARMRIVWLLERTDQLWGGVKVALTDANWLADRGHDVTVLSKSGPPSWMELRCAFRQVGALTPDEVPPADVVIGTFWTTVPVAAAVPGAKAVHFCQGYEGDMPEYAAIKDRIESVYRLPGMHHISIASHLTAMLRRRFGIDAHECRNAIDHAVHFPGTPRPRTGKVRVGLVGPYQVAWKDLATGYAACRLAHRAGLPIELVRVTNTAPHADERNLPFPVEWHERVPPAEMGAIYRSMDVFLGTSWGNEEGFFLPAVEAMACGVPCVLTDIPAFRDHGDHQYALFVPPRDPAAMAEALVVAARSPDIAAALRNGSIAAVQGHTQDAHGAALLRALEQIVGQPATSTTAADADDDLDAFERRTGRELRAAAARLADRGDHARAAAFLAAARCLRQDDPELAIEAAWALHLGGDSDAALGQFDAMLADGIDHVRVHECRAYLLNGTGRPDAAAQAFRAAIAAGLRNADTYNNLGVALYRTGDLAGARSSFERALVLDPAHADARANTLDLPVG